MSDTDFDLDDIEAQDEATLFIKNRDGETTTWAWTFYGPGHPKTVELANRTSKKFLTEAHDQKQAQLNNKKVKLEKQSPDELRQEIVDSIIERTKGFTPVKLSGVEIQYSPEAAKKLLLDPRKGALYKQVTEFLREDDSFMRPSVKT